MEENYPFALAFQFLIPEQRGHLNSLLRRVGGKNFRCIRLQGLKAITLPGTWYPLNTR